MKSIKLSKKLSIFFLTILIIVILLLGFSVLFSTVLTNTSPNKNLGNSSITTSITPVVINDKQLEAKNIISLSGESLNASKFPLTEKDITIDISSSLPVVLIKPCISKASSIGIRKVISVEELQTYLKTTLKDNIAYVLKNNNISDKNNIQYSYNASC